MQLKVKLLKGGRETAIEVENDSLTVLEVKRILEQVFEIPEKEQSLVYKGKALLDIRSLGSYGITDGAKLFLTHKPHARTPVTTSSAETTDPQALTGSTAGEGRAPRDPVAMEVDREERMVLTVKLLKGGREETVEFESDKVTVLEVKKVVERRCNIPTHQQSLVVGGKALADSQRLCDCNIKSGTRLFLAQKSSSTPPPPPPPPSQSCVWSHKTQFWDQLQTYLLLHFSQTDTEKIIHKMEEELKHCVYDVNLDTIEALANQILREQSHTHSA